MPPRTMQDVGTSPRSWYDSLPPVTKTFGTVAVLLALGNYAGLVSPYKLALLWDRVITNFEVWRPITACFYISGLNLKLVFEIIWLLQYGVQLEKGVYGTEPADYIFMLLFGAAFLQLAGLVVPFVKLYLLGSPLVYMVLYVWARFYPDVQLRIMGLVPLLSFYLPFAMVAMDVLTGHDPMPGVCGIMAGHLWWFLTDLYPRTSGRQVLPTPLWLKQLLASRGLGPAPPQARSHSAFRGQGQRLGTD